MSNDAVIQPNALVEMAYHPEALHQLRLLIVCLKKRNARLVDDDLKLQLTLDEYMETVRGKADIDDIKKAAGDLIGTSLTIYPDVVDQVIYFKEVIGILTTIQIDEETGTVEMVLNPCVVPYVARLQAWVAGLAAKYLLQLRTSSGIRLYERCVSWLSGENMVLDITDFRGIMRLAPDAHKRADRLIRHVVIPAVEDINQCTDMSVRFEQKTRERRIWLEFEIARKADKDCAAQR